VHGLFPFGATKVQPLGKSTIRVSAVPTVNKVAVTKISAAFVPVTPISEVDVAVALVIVAAFAGPENIPRTRAKLAAPVRADFKTLFTIFL
jgi:hypothetical protein